MEANFESRYYRSGDEDQIVEVLKSSFPDWARREDPVTHWRWKYLDAPLGSGIEVGLVDGRIICVNHTINLMVKVFSNVLLSQYGDDVATHPDFRGKGYFSSLSTLDNAYKANHGIAFSYSAPISPIAVGINIRKGLLSTPFKIRELIRIRDEGLYVRQNKVKNPLLVRLGLSSSKFYNKLLALLSGSPKREEDFAINEVTEFGDEFDAFWDSIKKNYDLIAEKSSHYLNWRYDPVSGEYKTFVAMKGDEILGYIICEVRRSNGSPTGFIDDLLFKLERRDVGDALFKRALDYLDGLGLNTVSYCLVRGSFDYDLSLRNGLIDPPTTKNLPFSAGYTNPAENVKLKDLDPRKIHYTYGDFQF